MNKLLIVALSLFWIIMLSNCKQEAFIQGKRIYEVNCENCHMADGKGLGAIYPDITNSAYLSTLKDDLVCLIINGKQSQIMENIVMPANKSLTPVGMNNLINYLNHTWGDGSISNLNDITERMQACN